MGCLLLLGCAFIVALFAELRPQSRIRARLDACLLELYVWSGDFSVHSRITRLCEIAIAIFTWLLGGPVVRWQSLRRIVFISTIVLTVFFLNFLVQWGLFCFHSDPHIIRDHIISQVRLMFGLNIPPDWVDCDKQPLLYYTILRDNELVSSDFPICDGCAGNAGSVFTVVYNFELPTPCLCVSSYVDARWMSFGYQHCARL